MPVQIIDMKLEKIQFKRTTASEAIADMTLDRGEPLLDLAKNELWVGTQDNSRSKIKLISGESLVICQDNTELPDLTDATVLYNIAQYTNKLYLVLESEYNGTAALYAIKRNSIDNQYKFIDVNNIGKSLTSNKMPKPISSTSVGHPGFENELARIDHIHPRADAQQMINDYRLTGVLSSEGRANTNGNGGVDLVASFSDKGLEEINKAAMMQALIFG